MMENATKGTDV
uniref:Uncharacterized protein n=1 Tax=Moniliophthora roreri TaxID=221103 RepID=A0A0W0G1A8_MONRR